MLEPGSVPSIPLQLDPPEHTPYKRFLISYFSTKRMTAFEPTSRRLARLELRVAIEETLARTRSFELSGPEPRRYRWPGNGPRSLPLVFELA
jgi:cytochrome P450